MSLSEENLQKAIENESKKFALFYRWLEEHMPPVFFEEVEEKHLFLITHNLMEFDLQNYYTQIYVNHDEAPICLGLCLDSPDADLTILKEHRLVGIKNYRSFVSNAPLPFPSVQAHLRIAVITFTEFSEKEPSGEDLLSAQEKKDLLVKVQEKNPTVTEEAFHQLIHQLNRRFLRAVPAKRLILALDMFFRAQERDNCQYEVRYQEEWQKTDSPSLQIIFAWKGVSKRNFLYELAKMVYRHKLALKRVNAIYIDPYGPKNIVLMSLAIHGAHGKAAWEEADIDDFLKELVTLKYFTGQPLIESTFVDTHLLTGNQGNLLKTISYFVHQGLIHFDMHAYAFHQIEEGLCRHPELIPTLINAFSYKFDPEKKDPIAYQKHIDLFLSQVEAIDTGNELNDTRRKNILKQAAYFVEFCLKTNFYRKNKSAFCFRLNPSYLDKMPYDRKEKFPSLPYAIYFMKGFHFLGFHIRFQDLARGGLRTVTPRSQETTLFERNNAFSECYNLSYTQQKKNKDIPEGGAKGVIFLEPYESLHEEIHILRSEWAKSGLSQEEMEKKVNTFSSLHKLEHLHQAQRAYIDSFLTLINCHPDGTLKAKDMIDYFQKPEYIYLGPDENMHNEMIKWIAERSQKVGYKPGIAFISSKPTLGFNHKEFGVTSYGIHVYMEEALRYLGLEPSKESFTLKMTGGPDGDVAGNEMVNLFRFYPDTAKLLTTIDVSGTIYDPNGLDLEEVKKLFLTQEPIGNYPIDKLSPGSFLLDTREKQKNDTLCIRNIEGVLVKEWLSPNEANHLLRHTVHKTLADIFIPGGGRPRTLHEKNIQDFLTQEGTPTAKAIIEGANLYLSQPARRVLEDLGVLIIKDSSANKGGVICSSFEVLSNLCLQPEEFLIEKPILIQEILDVIASRAKDEARLLFQTHRTSKAFLTDLSEEVSAKIQFYRKEIANLLQEEPLSLDLKDPFNQILLAYALPTLRKNYAERLIKEVPDIHKKAIIACHIASRIVYKKGLSYKERLSLPLLLQDPDILESS